MKSLQEPINLTRPARAVEILRGHSTSVTFPDIMPMVRLRSRSSRLGNEPSDVDELGTGRMSGQTSDQRIRRRRRVLRCRKCDIRMRPIIDRVHQDDRRCRNVRTASVLMEQRVRNVTVAACGPPISCIFLPQQQNVDSTVCIRIMCLRCGRSCTK
jgi:hypothetical protein